MNLAKVKKMTMYFIIVSLVVILGYDGWVVMEHGQEASISWAVITYSYDTPAVVFGVGFICGHLFWQLKNPKEKS